MPVQLNTAGVVGTDNVSPIYDENAPWKIWNMNEIYLGFEAAGKYVPKIGDEVHEITGSRISRYIVLDLNPVTFVPTLSADNSMIPDGVFDYADTLVGVGPGSPSEIYRVYVDKTTTPYSLIVDQRLYVYGTQTSYCKLFKGTNISSTGIVVSRMLDTAGNVISENVPLELVQLQNSSNVATKSVSPAYTNFDLQDNEIVTVVLYKADGVVVSKRQLLVENTGFVRSIDADRKYVTGISLKSPFINITNDRLIQYPINVPLSGLNLIGIVNYSDGEKKEYPVDNTRFSIFGFESYVATQVGQRIPLTIKYNLGQNEVSYSTVGFGGTSITEPFDAVTLNADGIYGLKLYAYPVWINDVSGYRLEWFLYNLERRIAYNVTPNVIINTNVSAFDPIGYGKLQRLSVSINVKDVDPTFRTYFFTQTLDIVLNPYTAANITNWSIGFAPGQNPRYGIATYATKHYVSVGNNKLRIDCNLTDFDDWIQKVYKNTLPLFDTEREAAPIAPTHFALLIAGIEIEYPISAWNQELTIEQSIPNQGTIYVKFIKKQVNNDLQLSIAGMVVFNVDAQGNFIGS